MSNYFVEDVICKVIEDYGPCPGEVGVAVKFRKDEEPAKWFTMIDFAGMPNCFLCDEYIMDILMYAETEEENEKADDFAARYAIGSFEGLNLLGEYEEIWDRLRECKDSALVKLITYILQTTLCIADETDDYISKGKGKNVSDIVIPDIDTFNSKLNGYLRKELYFEQDSCV